MSLLAVVILSGCTPDKPSADSGQRFTYVAASLVKEDQGAQYIFSGVVRSVEPMQASAAQGGRLVSVSANVGQTVSPGDVLATIDDTSAKIRIRQATEELRRIEALLVDRLAAAKRAVDLAATGSVSEASRSATVAEAEAGQAAVDAAKEALSLAENEAEQFLVRVFKTGIVSAREADVGAVVSPGQVLFSIESPEGRVIEASVPIAIADKLEIGEPAKFNVGALEGAAQVISISPKVESGGGLIVRLAVQNGNPHPGSIAQVSVDQGFDSTFRRVPTTSVTPDSSGANHVVLIDDNGQAQRVAVDIIGVAGADYRVATDLPVGASIVLAGGAFLQDGELVKIVVPGI